MKLFQTIAVVSVVACAGPTYVHAQQQRKSALADGWPESIYTSWAQGEYPDAQELQKGTPEAMATYLDETVYHLRCFDRGGNQVSAGSAFAISDRHLVTAFHVVDDCSSVVAHSLEAKVAHGVAGVVAYDNWMDIAILVTERSLGTEWALVLESIELPRKGARVFVTGNPLGIEGVFSEGRISGWLQEAHHGLGSLTFTAPISPGSSGCPVVNGRGALVGVVTSFVRNGQNLNIATPVEGIWNLLQSPPLKAVPFAELDRRMQGRLGVRPEVQKELDETAELGVGYQFFLTTKMMSAVSEDPNRRELGLKFTQETYELALAASARARDTPEPYQLLANHLMDYARDWAWLHYLHTDEGQAEQARQQRDQPAKIREDEIAIRQGLRAGTEQDVDRLEQILAFRLLRAERLRAERSGVAEEAWKYATQRFRYRSN